MSNTLLGEIGSKCSLLSPSSMKKARTLTRNFCGDVVHFTSLVHNEASLVTHLTKVFLVHSVRHTARGDRSDNQCIQTLDK